MKWITLELTRSADITRQVDEVCQTLGTLVRQSAKKPANEQQIQKAISVLTETITERIETMEAFYRANDLDPRAITIEASRLKLKRALHENGLDQVPTTKPLPKPAVPELLTAGSVPCSGFKNLR